MAALLGAAEGRTMENTITLEVLRAKLDAPEQLTLVEALGPMYYEAAHLPGAINIPHEEVDELAPKLLPDKDAQIVVYCASGPCKNSAIATRRLRRLGYSNVRDYHEGKAEWVAAGLPTERAAAVPFG
ncbi:MAG: rhodanese-like domain-containing protein [Gaiellaceae bacterium]